MKEAPKSMLALSAMASLAALTTGVPSYSPYSGAQPKKPTAGTGKRAHISGQDNGKTKLRIPRNVPCPCGKSGLKYKNCCGKPQ